MTKRNPPNLVLFHRFKKSLDGKLNSEDSDAFKVQGERNKIIKGKKKQHQSWKQTETVVPQADANWIESDSEDETRWR